MKKILFSVITAGGLALTLPALSANSPKFRMAEPGDVERGDSVPIWSADGFRQAEWRRMAAAPLPTYLAGRVSGEESETSASRTDWLTGIIEVPSEAGRRTEAMQEPLLESSEFAALVSFIRGASARLETSVERSGWIRLAYGLQALLIVGLIAWTIRQSHCPPPVVGRPQPPAGAEFS